MSPWRKCGTENGGKQGISKANYCIILTPSNPENQDGHSENLDANRSVLGKYPRTASEKYLPIAQRSYSLR